ncbi:MAG: SanA protein [Bacteroidia bacterium]|jgi:SanA protein
MRKLLRLSFYAGLILVIVLAACDTLIEQKSEGFVFAELSDIPSKKTALVLGTSYKNRNGYVNPYFHHRMVAAAELYKAGKVKYILVSGDNGRLGYDESTDMMEMLVSLGVPANVIYLDFAGFRTLDSVVRCKEVFSQNEIVVVSQEFHNQRAVFLSKANGLDAVAYNAKDIPMKYGFAVHVREKLARVKAVIDVVIGKEPKFLGPKIVVGDA